MTTANLPIRYPSGDRNPAAGWVIPPKKTEIVNATATTSSAQLTATSTPVIGPVFVIANVGNTDPIWINNTTAAEDTGVVVNPGAAVPFWATDLNELYHYSTAADQKFSVHAPKFDPAEAY